MIYWYWGTERVLDVEDRETGRGVRNGEHEQGENQTAEQEVCILSISASIWIPGQAWRIYGVMVDK